jgi:phosphocarrier protein
MSEVKKEIPIVNTLGMHARPAAQLVQTTLKFESEVYISLNGHKVNGKSIMGLLTLAAARGSRLEVSCEGPDADEAMKAIEELLASGFGET